QAGYRNLTVAIGGSATNDGGLGMAQALGIRFLDRNGDELKGCGANLENVDKIDTSGLIPEARSAQITVMCDVKNPLCGENGATYTYGPQKGATTEMLKELEAGMQNYRDVILREFGTDPDAIPGAGAAGGSGAA
ncbi:MAG: glycerate kinase, partial [Lachnospiraceae bacterium]|nr:glycerate kinase [Lachnospiraceae bacterium]